MNQGILQKQKLKLERSWARLATFVVISEYN